MLLAAAVIFAVPLLLTSCKPQLNVPTLYAVVFVPLPAKLIPPRAREPVHEIVAVAALPGLAKLAIWLPYFGVAPPVHVRDQVRQALALRFHRG